MRKLLVTLFVALPCGVFAQTATITINVNRPIAVIDPHIYGVFMEPIHLNGSRLGLPDSVEFNTLYGTVYDPASPTANEEGFSKAYIDAGRELHVTNMRWPGGNFLMGYDWKDGIGPKEQRPKRINLAWGGIDNNHVGTDEWMQLNRSIGSDNIVAVNLGLGNILDAAYLVEYCNYKGGTYYSDLRAKNGHPAPYHVKIWDLGNEVDGLPWELGHKNAADYVETAREAAKAMRAVDPTIQLVGSGSSYYEPMGKWIDWNRVVLEGIGDKINYLSIHRYWEGGTPDNYYAYMGNGAMDFDEKIRLAGDQIATASAKMNFKNPIYIAVDEWGAFGRNFMNVLPIAQCFNSFIRHADIVKMANFTAFSGLLSSDAKSGTFKTPLFYTFRQFSTNCLGTAVDTYVACDTFNTAQYKGIPYLDVSTVYSKDKDAVFINVVNRHRDRAIAATITTTGSEFTGKAAVNTITSEDLKGAFIYSKKEEYVPTSSVTDAKKGILSYSFPPHSFTQIRVAVHQ